MRIKPRYSFLLALLAFACQSPNVERQDSHLYSFSHFAKPSLNTPLAPPIDPEDDELYQEPPTPKRGLFFHADAPVIWPTSGRVTSEFGARGRRLHGGIDIAGGPGSKIVAVEKGRVAFIGRKRGYGKVVMLDHDEFKTLYAHCSRIRNLKVNQQIRRGQVIAYMGQTGNANGTHLHFEYRTKDDLRLDPRMILPRMDISLR